MSSTNAAEFPATPNHETVPILATPTGVAEKIEPDGEQQDTPNSPSPKPTTPERETPQPKKEQPEWEIRTLPDAFKNAEAPPWIIKDLVMSGTLTLVLYIVPPRPPAYSERFEMLSRTSPPASVL